MYLRVGGPSTRLVGSASMITAYRVTPSGLLAVEDSQLFAECPSCGRTMYRGHRQCLYCGEADPEPDPFDVGR